MLDLRPPGNVLLNLILAAVPVALAFGIALGARREMRATGRIRWVLWLPLLAIWLIFLPNTCYLLTEWRHYLATVTSTQIFFQSRDEEEARLDLILMTAFYIFYSGSGLLAFFLAIWPLDRLTRRRLGPAAWPVKGLLFALCALGVYLGLIPRFNSKDLVHLEMVHLVLRTAWHSLARPRLDLLLLGFAAILWLLYAFFDIWMDGVLWRTRSRRRSSADEA